MRVTWISYFDRILYSRAVEMNVLIYVINMVVI